MMIRSKIASHKAINAALALGVASTPATTGSFIPSPVLSHDQSRNITAATSVAQNPKPPVHTSNINQPTTSTATTTDSSAAPRQEVDVDAELVDFVDTIKPSLQVFVTRIQRWCRGTEAVRVYDAGLAEQATTAKKNKYQNDKKRPAVPAPIAIDWLINRLGEPSAPGNPMKEWVKQNLTDPLVESLVGAACQYLENSAKMALPAPGRNVMQVEAEVHAQKQLHVVRESLMLSWLVEIGLQLEEYCMTRANARQAAAATADEEDGEAEAPPEEGVLMKTVETIAMCLPILWEKHRGAVLPTIHTYQDFTRKTSTAAAAARSALGKNPGAPRVSQLCTAFAIFTPATMVGFSYLARAPHMVPVVEKHGLFNVVSTALQIASSKSGGANLSAALNETDGANAFDVVRAYMAIGCDPVYKDTVWVNSGTLTAFWPTFTSDNVTTETKKKLPKTLGDLRFTLDAAVVLPNGHSILGEHSIPNTKKVVNVGAWHPAQAAQALLHQCTTFPLWLGATDSTSKQHQKQQHAKKAAQQVSSCAEQLVGGLSVYLSNLQSSAMGSQQQQVERCNIVVQGVLDVLASCLRPWVKDTSISVESTRMYLTTLAKTSKLFSMQVLSQFQPIVSGEATKAARAAASAAAVTDVDSLLDGEGDGATSSSVPEVTMTPEVMDQWQNCAETFVLLFSNLLRIPQSTVMIKELLSMCGSSKSEDQFLDPDTGADLLRARRLALKELPDDERKTLVPPVLMGVLGSLYVLGTSTIGCVAPEPQPRVHEAFGFWSRAVSRTIAEVALALNHRVDKTTPSGVAFKALGTKIEPTNSMTEVFTVFLPKPCKLFPQGDSSLRLCLNRTLSALGVEYAQKELVPYTLDWAQTLRRRIPNATSAQEASGHLERLQLPSRENYLRFTQQVLEVQAVVTHGLSDANASEGFALAPALKAASQHIDLMRRSLAKPIPLLGGGGEENESATFTVPPLHPKELRLWFDLLASVTTNYEATSDEAKRHVAKLGAFCHEQILRVKEFTMGAPPSSSPPPPLQEKQKVLMNYFQEAQLRPVSGLQDLAGPHRELVQQQQGARPGVPSVKSVARLAKAVSAVTGATEVNDTRQVSKGSEAVVRAGKATSVAVPGISEEEIESTAAFQNVALVVTNRSWQSMPEEGLIELLNKAIHANAKLFSTSLWGATEDDRIIVAPEQQRLAALQLGSLLEFVSVAFPNPESLLDTMHSLVASIFRHFVTAMDSAPPQPKVTKGKKGRSLPSPQARPSWLLPLAWTAMTSAFSKESLAIDKIEELRSLVLQLVWSGKTLPTVDSPRDSSLPAMALCLKRHLDAVCPLAAPNATATYSELIHLLTLPSIAPTVITTNPEGKQRREPLYSPWLPKGPVLQQREEGFDLSNPQLVSGLNHLPKFDCGRRLLRSLAAINFLDSFVAFTGQSSLGKNGRRNSAETAALIKRVLPGYIAEALCSLKEVGNLAQNGKLAGPVANRSGGDEGAAAAPADPPAANRLVPQVCHAVLVASLVRMGSLEQGSNNSSKGGGGGSLKLSSSGEIIGFVSSVCGRDAVMRRLPFLASPFVWDKWEHLLTRVESSSSSPEDEDLTRVRQLQAKQRVLYLAAVNGGNDAPPSYFSIGRVPKVMSQAFPNGITSTSLGGPESATGGDAESTEDGELFAKAMWTETDPLKLGIQHSPVAVVNMFDEFTTEVLAADMNSDEHTQDVANNQQEQRDPNLVAPSVIAQFVSAFVRTFATEVETPAANCGGDSSTAVPQHPPNELLSQLPMTSLFSLCCLVGKLNFVVKTRLNTAKHRGLFRLMMQLHTAVREKCQGQLMVDLGGGTGMGALGRMLGNGSSLKGAPEYEASLKIHEIDVKAGGVPNAGTTRASFLTASTAILGHNGSTPAIAEHGTTDETANSQMTSTVDRLCSFLEASLHVPHHGLSQIMQALTGKVIREQLDKFSTAEVMQLMSLLQMHQKKILLFEEVAASKQAAEAAKALRSSSNLDTEEAMKEKTVRVVNNETRQQWWAQLVQVLMSRAIAIARRKPARKPTTVAATAGLDQVEEEDDALEDMFELEDDVTPASAAVSLSSTTEEEEEEEEDADEVEGSVVAALAATTGTDIVMAEKEDGVAWDAARAAFQTPDTTLGQRTATSERVHPIIEQPPQTKAEISAAAQDEAIRMFDLSLEEIKQRVAAVTAECESESNSDVLNV